MITGKQYLRQESHQGLQVLSEPIDLMIMIKQ